MGSGIFMHTSTFIRASTALALARAWLASFAGDEPSVRVWGEDDTGRVLPVAQIDPEFRNPLYSAELESLWR